jgi:hypothetical protein
MLALSIVFYWKLALTDQYVWFDHPDMAYLEIPRLQFQANEIHRGQFPLWNPRIWMGQPLIGQTQPGPLYPFNLLFYLLPLTNGYIPLAHLNWYWVLLHAQAGLFAYWLARDLGLSRMGAIIGGSLFAFGGFVGVATWLDVVNGSIWTPLVILLLFRSVRGRGSIPYAILGGFVLGIAWLSGHHELPLLATYLCLFTWAFQIFQHQPQPGGQVWFGRFDVALLRAAVVFFGVMFLTSAVQISHRWIGLENTVGWKDTIPYISQTMYSMSIRSIVGLVLFGASEGDANMFFGATGVGLAMLGLLAGWKKRWEVRWLGVVAGVGLLYCLGAWTPLQGLLYKFAPMLGKARVPLRAIHLVHFALAILAAYGIEWLLDRTERRWFRAVAFGWVAFGAIFVAIALTLPLLAHREMDERVLLSAWIALAVAGLGFAYRGEAISRNAAAGSILAMILVELTVELQFPHKLDKEKNRYVNAFRENADVVQFLKQQPWPFRVTVNDTDVPMNFGDYHGLDMYQGYVAGVSDNLLRHGMHTPETQRLFASTYWLAKNPDRPGQEPIFQGASGLKVFRNPGAMPRAWAVHAGSRVSTPDELRAAVSDPGFDPWKSVLMLDAEVPAMGSCEPSTPATNEVRVTRHHSNRISMRAEMRCKGLVILADTFFPGWVAVVDGKEVPVIETYGALRGILLDAGGHNIEMKFKPKMVFGGGILTLCGVLLAAWAWWRRPDIAAPETIGSGTIG